MHAAEGILTSRGGMTSHAAVVARGWGKPCIVAATCYVWMILRARARSCTHGPAIRSRRFAKVSVFILCTVSDHDPYDPVRVLNAVS